MRKSAILILLFLSHLGQVTISVISDCFIESISGYDSPFGYYNGRYICYFLISAIMLELFGYLLIKFGGRVWLFPVALCVIGTLGIVVTLISGCLPDTVFTRWIELFGRMMMRLAACPLAALNIVIGRRTPAVLLTVVIWGILSGVLFALCKNPKKTD